MTVSFSEKSISCDLSTTITARSENAQETNQYYIECEPKSEWDRKEKKKKDSLGTKAGGNGGYEWYSKGKTDRNK